MLTSELAQIVVGSKSFRHTPQGAKRLSTVVANGYEARLPAAFFAHSSKAEQKGEQGECYGDAQDLMPGKPIRGIDFDQIAQKLVDAVQGFREWPHGYVSQAPR